MDEENEKQQRITHLRKWLNEREISVDANSLEGLLHAIEKSLPHPQVEINCVIPYDRGDLVSAIHEHGEIISEVYEEAGTLIHARVDAGLAQAITAVVSLDTSGE
jgi:GTP-binding protein HflX